MLVEAEAGSMRRLHAKDRMAAVARRAVQREVQARAADRRRDGGVDDALFARSRMKVFVSSLQRPQSQSRALLAGRGLRQSLFCAVGRSPNRFLWAKPFRTSAMCSI